MTLLPASIPFFVTDGPPLITSPSEVTVVSPVVTLLAVTVSTRTSLFRDTRTLPFSTDVEILVPSPPMPTVSPKFFLTDLPSSAVTPKAPCLIPSTALSSCPLLTASCSSSPSLRFVMRLFVTLMLPPVIVTASSQWSFKVIFVLPLEIEVMPLKSFAKRTFRLSVPSETTPILSSVVSRVLFVIPPITETLLFNFLIISVPVSPPKTMPSSIVAT